MKYLSNVLWPLGGIAAALVTWALLTVGAHLYADHLLVDAIRVNIQQSQSRNVPDAKSAPEKSSDR